MRGGPPREGSANTDNDGKLQTKGGCEDACLQMEDSNGACSQMKDGGDGACSDIKEEYDDNSLLPVNPCDLVKFYAEDKEGDNKQKVN